MAEVNPELVGRSGVDPITGSVLSKEVRDALLKKGSATDTTLIRSDLIAVESRRRQIDNQNVATIQDQEKALLGLNSSINALRNDIGRLSSGLNNIALLLQQDSTEEQARIKRDQDTQRVLTEQKIRAGKEDEIESKIQGAILKPIEKLAPKMDDLFGSIRNSLALLMTGWGLVEFGKLLKSYQEGNTKKFEEIKFGILKNLGILSGGLFALWVGFKAIKKTILFVAGNLAKLIIAKPLALLARPFANLLPKKPKPGRGGTPPVKGKGAWGVLSALATGITGFMNAKNGEYSDAIVAALSLVGPGKFVRILAGVGYGADEIAEVFGMNFIGKNSILSPFVEKIKEEAQKLMGGNKNTTSTQTDSSKNIPDKKPEVKPKETMMGTPVPPALPSTAPSEQSSSQPPVSEPSEDMVNKFEMAWKYRNNPLARGRIEGAWNQMTPEQQQQAKNWAQMKGYDWNEMKLKEKPTDGITPNPMSKQPSEADIKPPSPAQMTSTPQQPEKVGQLPEPKPSLTMIKTSSSKTQQTPPMGSGSLTDVPLIKSGNPDNFYVLYSQLNYNVVI